MPCLKKWRTHSCVPRRHSCRHPAGVVTLLLMAPLLTAEPLNFMGRDVTIIEPEREDEFFPKGPATVCLEGPPERQCYTPSKEYGNSPEVKVVQVKKGMPALLFKVESGGVSG